VARSLAVAALVAAGLLAGAPGAQAAAPFCGITWGSGDKQAGDLNPAPLVDVRTGRHTCYDRVVFDFRGKANGYLVGYVTEVTAEGSGNILRVNGAAKIQVSLRNPSYDASGHSTYPATVGEHVANVAGYRTLRDVVFAGSFEGYSAFGLGLRARLPFRVFALPGPGSNSRIVIDIAHRW
jgi:hypothetical protein